MGKHNIVDVYPMGVEASKSFDEKFSSGASIETGVSGRAGFDAAADGDTWRRRKPSETSSYEISEITSHDDYC